MAIISGHWATEAEDGGFKASSRGYISKFEAILRYIRPCLKQRQQQIHSYWTNYSLETKKNYQGSAKSDFLLQHLFLDFSIIKNTIKLSAYNESNESDSCPAF